MGPTLHCAAHYGLQPVVGAKVRTAAAAFNSNYIDLSVIMEKGPGGR